MVSFPCEPGRHMKIEQPFLRNGELREPRESAITLNWDEEVPPVDVVDAATLPFHSPSASDDHHVDRERVVASVSSQLRCTLRAFCK
jgi:hypothetical protein